jgi:Do/DeqQ family serine protease
MKGKYLLGGLLMALLGAAIALFGYTKIIQKPAEKQLLEMAKAEVPDASAILTSFQMQEGQVDFTYSAEQTVHAVVHVRTKAMLSQPSNPFMEWFLDERYSRPREVKGYGSGVIISDDGYIITNNHVIENAENIEVKLNDNRVFNADVIGRDPNTDLALLKIKAPNLSYIKYGNSEQLKIGEWVLAVGNPFNLTSTVTAGIVSAKGRNLDISGENDYRIESFIQTDAALNMGNSGGALVNTKGLLVGITSAIYSPNGAYAGNSFAIPVSIVKKVVEDLKQYGEVQRALIGVKISEVSQEDAEKNNLNEVKGALISEITPGGAAEDADLKKNDVIIKIDGVNVNTVSELQEQIGKHRPGDKAAVTYMRNGKENTVSVTLKNVAGNTSVVTTAMGIGEVFGARLEALNSSEKRSYNIDYGVKITDLKDGKFKEYGFRKNTIILSINGKRIKNADEARQAIGSGEKSLKSIEGIQADGTEFSYQFRN